MNGLKINAALIFAMALQACALVWFLSQQNSKIEEIYKFYQQESEKSVVENQVKMKLDLANLIEEVKKIKKDLKSANKTDKKIMNQHKQIFELLNSDNSNRSYSYGD